MNYGELFEKAWRVIWKNKVLWLFGILASCSANRGSESTLRYSFDSQNTRGMDPFNRLFPGLYNFFNNLERGLQDGSAWPAVIGISVAFLCLILIIWIVSLVLGTFGRSGLVRGAWLADAGAERLSFGQLWNDARPYFWRVLGLTLLLMVLGWVIGLLIIIPVILFAVLTLGCGLILLIPLAIIAAWLVNVWLELTIIAIVGEDLSIREGAWRGWQVIRENLGATIVVSLILFVGSLIAFLLISLPFLAIVLPVLMGIFSQTEAGIMTGLIVGGVLLLLYLPVALLLGGVIQAFITTVWTLFFRRATARLSAPAIVPTDPTGAAAYDVLDGDVPPAA